MKRHGHLYPQIIAFENLLISSRQAQRSKRFRPNVLDFNYHIEPELERLQTELQQRIYIPGGYKTFRIFDPKPRLISAAPYRDRVVHHALCNIIAPIIERTFIHDTYANRTGFGTHRALRRFTEFARSSRYILQCDIRLYFPSIDREILKTILRRKLKCPDTLWLIDRILDNSNPQEPVIDYFPGDDLLAPITHPHGLPIGNLTSQFFANVYLSGFDRFVKEHLKIDRYLRYVDDFALFSDDRSQLVAARIAIEDYLASLRLKLHPIKSQLFETQCGANFVGFRVLPDRIRVRNDNLRRGRRRLNQLQQDFDLGKITWEQVSQSCQSWDAHLQHGNTYRLRQHIFDKIPSEEGIFWRDRISYPI
jgi:retron-type reverse transcriptase